ncbi:Hypothetical predicted protein, partial [Pelobates cultripes]
CHTTSNLSNPLCTTECSPFELRIGTRDVITSRNVVTRFTLRLPHCAKRVITLRDVITSQVPKRRSAPKEFPSTDSPR